MTTTLTREDTGEMAIVRVIDPGVHVSAPYSRAVGLLDRWAKAERRAVDEFAAWIEGQYAQIEAEMRALCDELGLPVTARMTDTPRDAPPWWPTANHLAEHRGVDLLIKHRWDIDAMRAPDLVAQLNAGLKRIWPPDVQPGSVQWAELPPGDGLPVLAAAYRGERDGWTPTRPAVLAGPAPDETMPGREALTPRSQVQAGPWWRAVVDVLGKWVRL
jgi:hypothetical protein